MRTVRTDGGGTFENNERLMSLKQLLNHFGLQDKIDLLHDHKGCLTVNWTDPPTIGDLIIVGRAWNGFNDYEIDHTFDGINIFVNAKSFDI
jgi:hypothetical protein